MTAWYQDFFGPGGVAKGYAYLEEPPPAHLLVDSIDANSEPGAPEGKDLFRHIKGRWYLFYSSHD